MSEPLLTAEELAQRLGVTHDWVYRNRDELPHFRVGVLLRFDWEEVLESLREKDVA